VSAEPVTKPDATGAIVPEPSMHARIPQHVVYRPFVEETVLLNLETGQYHGVNSVAGRMLEVVERADSLQAAAEQLAEEYRVPVAELLDDLLGLCSALAARGLIVLEPAAA
jgi:hypothetical protein